MKDPASPGSQDPSGSRWERGLSRARRLVAGDRVAVVAPSGPVDPVRLAAGLEHLRAWGLRPEPGASVLAAQGYLAGADALRAADLQQALGDPGVRAVLCARGGYGAQRVLDLVDWTALRTTEPTVLVGASDITALHEAVACELGVASLFGPMPASEVFVTDESTREYLRRTLFAPETVQELRFPDGVELVPGRASGVTVGGTLALLASSLGTRSSRPARGGIAVLEDVGEAPYRLDRALTQLLRAGWFDGVRGIVLGTFTACGPPGAAGLVLLERLGGLGVPLLGGADVGHGPRTQAVPLGLPAVLDAAAGTLSFAEPALR